MNCHHKSWFTVGPRIPAYPKYLLTRKNLQVSFAFAYSVQSNGRTHCPALYFIRWSSCNTKQVSGHYLPPFNLFSSLSAFNFSSFSSSSFLLCFSFSSFPYFPLCYFKLLSFLLPFFHSLPSFSFLSLFFLSTGCDSMSYWITLIFYSTLNELCRWHIVVK